MTKKIRNELKKLLASCLVIIFIFPRTIVSAATTDGMDNLDVLIMAHYFLVSEKMKDSWSDSLIEAEIVPLYNAVGAITCYYVEVDNIGYAVVNNNTANPTAIEFGDGDNLMIRDILNRDPNPHIIYNNPMSLYNTNEVAEMRSKASQYDIYENYPDLKQVNTELANMLSEQKHRIKDNSSIMLYGDGDYGFIEWENMPLGNHTSYNIPYAGTSWVVTGDFTDIAKDHCAATAVTNLAMYFANRGYTKLKKSSNRQTFIAVHDIVGNGPVMTIAGKTKEYFSNCGYSLNYKSVSDFDGIKSATKKGRPCGILLADGITAWHWIISVGYREYTNSGNYIRVMDGWNRDVNRFYKPGSGSLWISATEYWV